MNQNVEDELEILNRSTILRSTKDANFPTYKDFVTQNGAGGRVLDFGCANHSTDTSLIGGEFTHSVLSGVSSFLLGVDIVQYEGQKASNGKYICVDLLKNVAEANLLTGGNFDIFFAGNVIEHLNSTENFFKVAHDVLNDEGKLIVSTVNPLWIIGIWDRFKLTYQSNCVDHTIILGPPEFLELARRHNFTLDSWAYIGKEDMTERFEPGGRIFGRIIGAVYKYLRFSDNPCSYNLVGAVFVKNQK